MINRNDAVEIAERSTLNTSNRTHQSGHWNAAAMCFMRSATSAAFTAAAPALESLRVDDLTPAADTLPSRRVLVECPERPNARPQKSNHEGQDHRPADERHEHHKLAVSVGGVISLRRSCADKVPDTQRWPVPYSLAWNHFQTSLVYRCDICL